MANEREFLSELRSELNKLRTQIENGHRLGKALSLRLVEEVVDQLERLLDGWGREFAHDGPGSTSNTTPTAPAEKSMDDKRAAACGAIHDYCEGVEADEFFKGLERKMRERGMNPLPYPGAKEDAEDLWIIPHEEGVRHVVGDDFEERAEIDSECWEELEDVREIAAGLRGHFPDMVRKMIHVVRMEAKHKAEGIYLTDSIVLRLLRSIEEEDRLPDGHPIRVWVGQKIPHYT